MVFPVLLTWIQVVPALSCCCPAGIWSLCVGTRGGVTAAQRDPNLGCQSFGCCSAGHPQALPEPLLSTHLLPTLPVPSTCSTLHPPAPRAHPHPEPVRRALAGGKAVFGLHGSFDGFFFSSLLPTWLPPPFSSELVTAICSTALSVGKAGMSDWSRRDVPASGAGAWLPRSAGTAAPSTERLQNEFSFSFFQTWSLMDSSLISPLPELSSDAALAIRS